jgi:hypothetical protein
MHIAQQDPLLARDLPRGVLAVRQATVLGAAEHERAGVARVVDDLSRPTVQELGPHQLALVRAAAQPAREQQLLRVELLDHRQTRSGASEGFEEQPHCPLHLRVRIEHDAVPSIMHKAYRHHLLELATPGAAQDATAQACLEHMQFRFAHRPLQAEQQAVVEVCRIIQPVLIEDKRVAERTQLEQSMPVGVVAREARHFQSEYDPDTTKTDLGDKALKALAVGGTRPGLPEVAVDNDDAIERPTERDGALAQRILALRALGVLEHLP